MEIFCFVPYLWISPLADLSAVNIWAKGDHTPLLLHEYLLFLCFVGVLPGVASFYFILFF